MSEGGHVEGRCPAGPGARRTTKVPPEPRAALPAALGPDQEALARRKVTAETATAEVLFPVSGLNGHALIAPTDFHGTHA